MGGGAYIYIYILGVARSRPAPRFRVKGRGIRLASVRLLEKLTSGTTHNTKVYQEQLEAFIAELKVQKAEAAVKKMTDPVDEGGCGGSVEGLLMHLSDILVMYYSRC